MLKSVKSLVRKFLPLRRKKTKTSSRRKQMERSLRQAGAKGGYHISILSDLFPYSYYAYGLLHGCKLAKALGIPRVSAIEFGVAGGNGLVAMERHAKRIEELTGVAVEVYGFDTGTGLTPPVDYRDMPYRFKKGNYEMNIPALKGRLERAKLILGDIRETAGSFLETCNPAPIAFASFDMDYYSSTMHAFSIFAQNHKDDYFLPRIFAYFDDIVGVEVSAYNEFVGELAAIADFNSQNTDVKIAENRVFRNYDLNFAWYHQSYIMHRFKHPLFDKYISRASRKSLSLKPDGLGQ